MPVALSNFPYAQLRVNRMLWGMIAFSIAIEYLAIWYYGFTIQAPYAVGVIEVILVCTSIMVFYRYVRRDDGIALFSGALAQLILGGFAIVTGSYLAAYINFPLVDAGLIRADATMGFDWHEYVAWIDARPFMASLLSVAYTSYGIQFTILLPLLFYSCPAHGQRVYIGLYVAGIITVILSAIFPAVGAYVFYDMNAQQLPSIPSTARVHEQLLLGLMHHTLNVIPYPGEGIVTFPSYHSVIAVMLIYAAIPYRMLFPLALPINLLMLLSTPFNGGHYLSDVLGGIFAAVLGIILAERMLPREAVNPLAEGRP